MLVAGISFHKNAASHGFERPYIARLSLDSHGAVQREFGKRRVGKTNRRDIQIEARPGDVFEARRWNWNGDAYVGGVVWFGVDGAGELVPLTRDEAMASLDMPRLPQPAAEGAPAPVPAVARVKPENVYVVEIDDAAWDGQNPAAEPKKIAPATDDHPLSAGEVVEHASGRFRYGRGRVQSIRGDMITVQWLDTQRVGTFLRSAIRRATVDA